MVVYYTERSDKEQVKILTRSTGYDTIYTVQYAIIKSYLETESGVQWLNYITPTKTFSVFTLFFLMTKPNFSIAISITHCKTLFPSILP